jgi:type IV pilus assembly protein PilY1
MSELSAMNTKYLYLIPAILAGILASGQGRTQTVYSEDFTGATTTNQWYFFSGACLTAGTSNSLTSPGIVPSCKALSSYYTTASGDHDPAMVGGNSGYLGATTAPSGFATVVADPVGFGALRFTNGAPYGHNERGAILSANTFNTGQGLQVTFKTVTYRGSTGTGGDGADGISFFLMDGSKPAGIGATGGSLAYSCSNANPNYDGLNGGYIGLGIDEWGNFLNGAHLVTGYTGTNVVVGAAGDNSAYGYGYKPGRIGLRGAGSISWAALTAAYGTYQGSSKPYYPSSMTTTFSNSTFSCAAGTNYNNQFCWSCPIAYTAYPGAPITPAGTITGNGTNCFDTLYSSIGTCPAASSYTSYSGAASTPAGTITFSGGHCIDTLYSSVGTCPATYTSYAGAPSSPAGTVTFGSGRCRYKVTVGGTTTTYNGPVTAAYTGPATTVYTGLPTITPVTTTGGSGTTLAVSAVQQACSTGNLYNYYNPAAPVSVTPATINANNPANILDYAPIPNAYKELTGFTIAKENAITRNDTGVTPIFYNLKITQDGLLSLAYSTSGGAYSYLIKNQNITASNGNLPATFRFGFAGSTGGATNVHEIMCFKAASADTSGSSATVNEKQAAKVEAGTQAYFAFYNPNNWTGALTANNLIDDGNGVVSVSSVANWDASCLLTGTPAGTVALGGGCATTNTSGPTSPTPTENSSVHNRVILTWDSVGQTGIPFEWANLNANQQAALDYEGPPPNIADSGAAAQYRLNYLRGDRSNEITTLGTGLYRARDSVLGDIVDSSPNWVGPPSASYTATWTDRLAATTTMPENTGTETYLQFIARAQGRLNVVYGGANDGFLHGFRAGSFDANGLFCGTTGSALLDCSTTPNDGREVLAYMPGSTIVSAADSSSPGGCTDSTHTGTIVQSIRGTTPAISSNAQCIDSTLDYANTQYGHNFFVDATPISGDLFYGGTWHTWLVGGLGAGGAAIYALDVTDPSASNFQETNASNIVRGEWNANSISCVSSGCGSNLGNTYGTPQIRRLHNGNWGVIFGNGFGSASGDAGIYVMSIDNSTAAKTIYYLSTNTAGGNGIAYVAPTDLDGDHITDYVYAGDLKGNVWRFDLTNSDPTLWAASAAPLFTTPSGQPITSQLLAISNNLTPGLPRLMIEFGTGQRTQITNAAPEAFASGIQSIYAVWDWNMAAWNTLSTGAHYASLAATAAATGLASPFTIPAPALNSSAVLQQQTFTPNASTGVRDGTNVAVCWQGTPSCAQFGWYVNLPGSQEQVIFNPVFFNGAFIVNSTVPANNLATTCSNTQDTGFTYAISVSNGGVFTNAFPNYTKNGLLIVDPIEAGIETGATGSVYVVGASHGKTNIVYQTVSGTPSANQVNIPTNTKAKRLTWIEKR